MKVFTVVDDMLVLDKDELRGVPEFKRLLERDKGSKGDQDGRKKFKAFKEFYYIYVVADLFSFPNQAGYNEKEVHIMAVKEADLDSDFKPDDDVKAGITKYKEIQNATLPALNSLITILRGLRVADNISQRIISNIEKTLELQQTKQDEALTRGEPIDLGSSMAVTQGLVSQLDQLMGIANKLPKTIDTLESIKERVGKEQSGDDVARGGKSIGTRADPK